MAFFFPSSEGFCSPEWDGIVCWPEGPPGKLISTACPEYIYDFDHKGEAGPAWSLTPQLLLAGESTDVCANLCIAARFNSSIFLLLIDHKL